MANNKLVTKDHASGLTVYAAIKNLDGDIWDKTLAGATFTAIDSIDWANDAGTAMPEQGATGQYRVAIPAALPYGVYEFSIRSQAGGSPAIGDTELELQTWFWDGTDKHDASVFTTEIDFEPVPPERTFVLKPTKGQSLIGEAVKSGKTGTAPTFAFDFQNDMATNGEIATVSDPTFVPASGVSLVSKGRDRSLAKLRLSLSAKGTYTITLPVTYANGSSAKGTVTLEVVA